MKTRLLILFVLVLIPIQLIYATPAPDPKSAYDYAKHVVVGKILSVEILSEPDIQRSENTTSIIAGIALYEIEVEKYLKNPINTKIIKVPGYFVNEVDPWNTIGLHYKIDQRVLLYIQEDTHDVVSGYDLIIRNYESQVVDGSICELGTSYHQGVCTVDGMKIVGESIDCSGPGIISKEQCEYEKLTTQVFFSLLILFFIVGILVFIIWRKRK